MTINEAQRQEMLIAAKPLLRGLVRAWDDDEVAQSALTVKP